MPIGDIGTYEGYGFRLAAATGLLTGTISNASIFSFRNGVASRKVRILAVNVNAAGSFQAAGNLLLAMFVARNFSASDSGGTNLAGLSAGNNSNKLRTSQNASIILAQAGATVQVATTTNLTAGTRTLDANAVGNIIAAASTTGANMIQDVPLYSDYTTMYGVPLVLAANEGFVVNASAVAGTGTFQVGISVLYAEVDGGAAGTG